MDDINIGIKIPVSLGDIDHDKVLKLVKKFIKSGEKVGANAFEVGAAISVLQDHYLEVFGAIPISEGTIAAIRDAHMLEAKEG